MVVSRVSPQEGFHVQGKNLASSDFKRLCREGKVEAALEAMNEMEKNGVLLDEDGLVKLLQVCEDKKLLGAGKRVFEYVTKSPSKPNTVVFNKLVDMFCKLGDTRTARTVFEKMALRNLDSWNKMLVGLAENGEGGEAIEFFSRMKKDGVRPDGSSFLGVIMACGRLGAVKEGQEHFVSMSRDHGITPSVEHYLAIVDLLGRSQKIAEAKEFIEKVPVESSSVVRETLQKYSTTETKGRLDEPSPSKSPSGLKVGNKRKVKGKLISRQKKSLKSAKKPPRILRKIPKGVIHIQASFNNTIVTVTDLRGGVICWSSAGSCKFKGTKRGTPFAAENAARNAIQKVMKHGMLRAEVMINGPGLGRDAALRAIRRSGIVLSFVRDVTPLPHNGCRPPKKRRV